MTSCQPTPIRRPGRPAALSLFVALLCLGGVVPPATAADARDDTIRRLEEQLRRATDRIDELLKLQKLERDESAKQRDVAQQLRQALDVERKKAAEQLAADAARTARAIDALKKEAADNEAAAREEAAKLAAKLADETKKARLLVREELQRAEDLAAERAKTAKALEKAIEEERKLLRGLLDAEKKKALLALEQERARAAAAHRDVEAAVLAAEKKARATQEVIATLMQDAARLKIEAAVAQQLLQERAARLEKRLSELEKALERARVGAERIEGKVTAVNDGLVKLNLGSDAGLANGQVLDVFRLEPKPLYLGQVKIVSVEAKEAVAVLVVAPKEAIKVGDRVTNKP